MVASGYTVTLRDGITNLSCILFVHRYRFKFPLSFELIIRNWLVNLKIANVVYINQVGHFLNCGINISQTGFLRDLSEKFGGRICTALYSFYFGLAFQQEAPVVLR